MLETFHGILVCLNSLSSNFSTRKNIFKPTARHGHSRLESPCMERWGEQSILNQGHPGSCSEFQASLGKRVRLCLQNPNKTENPTVSYLSHQCWEQYYQHCPFFPGKKRQNDCPLSKTGNVTILKEGYFNTYPHSQKLNRWGQVGL